jgi:hypothetical protein
MQKINFSEASDFEIKIAAKWMGLDEKPKFMDVIEDENFTKKQRTMLVKEMSKNYTGLLVDPNNRISDAPEDLIWVDVQPVV